MLALHPDALFLQLKYFYDKKALWTVDYVRGLGYQTISHNDDDEDQDIQPREILNYSYKDELSIEDGVYDKHSNGDIPDYRDVEPPLKDMYVLASICMDHISNLQTRYSLGHWHGYLYDSEGIRREKDSMMTFLLVPAKGEQKIEADAWSHRGRYGITGSWSKSKNGVIQIKLKLSFLAASWPPKFFDGHFDPERDALTGVWGVSAELERSTKGKMECRRIPPRYLTLYPNLKELSDDKPLSLWRFAISAVRNDIRRDYWSWSCFSQRRDDRESVTPLLVRSRYFGPPLIGKDIQTLGAILPRLTSMDACFYSSKANLIRAHTWVHE